MQSTFEQARAWTLFRMKPVRLGINSRFLKQPGSSEVPNGIVVIANSCPFLDASLEQLFMTAVPVPFTQYSA